MKVKVTLLDQVTNAKIVRTGDFTADANGIWTGKVMVDLPPSLNAAQSRFKLLIKGPKHLQKRICDSAPKESYPGTYHCEVGNITLNPSASNDLDLSGIYLLVGDLPQQDGTQDGIVNSFDTSLILQLFGKTDQASLAQADLNLDGVINPQDYSLVIAALSIRSDEGDSDVVPAGR
jgi:hypothetical protein